MAGKEDYTRFSFITGEDSGVLIARLSELPFSGFEEDVGILHAYIPAAEDTVAFRQKLDEAVSGLNVYLSSSEIPWENWNARWEQSFSPVVIDGRIRIRASFHESDPSCKYEIVIDPRMAFGTGHHATTSMMMKALEKLNVAGKSVLDFGCGTGLLSILASMLGAGQLLAIDNDELAIENTLHNCMINNIRNVEVMTGSLNLVKGRWEVILANINKDIILHNLERFQDLLTDRGNLAISGILARDREEIKNTFQARGFDLQFDDQLQGWCCLVFTASSP
jgi:ribosomal protein L11 methyltransferase